MPCLKPRRRRLLRNKSELIHRKIRDLIESNLRRALTSMLMQASRKQRIVLVGLMIVMITRILGEHMLRTSHHQPPVLNTCLVLRRPLRRAVRRK